MPHLGGVQIASFQQPAPRLYAESFAKAAPQEF
jgi:hypothetical protein